MKKLPIFELFIEDDNEYLGLALVDNPAIEKDFIYFGSDKSKMVFNEEKMIVKGPALIPNQLIYRNDLFGERYVFFSEETIINFVEKLMDKKDNKFNLDHTENYLNATMLESYFAVEPNEFNVPKNSWIVSLKIKDNDTWNKVKSGEYNGFSIQGIFSEIINNFNKTKEMSDLKTKLANAINAILFGEDEKVEETKEVVEMAEEVPVDDVPVVEEPVDEVPVEEPMTPEQILEKVGEMIKEMETKILSVIEEKIKDVDDKVEEFGKQPLNIENKKEEVETPRNFSTPATRFFPNK